MTALVSVIIPTFNRRHDLCRCVESVLMQTSATTEIIVVDDCSEDDTREFLRSNYPDVCLISCDRR
jgi:glycosyltransferase involved in cell wall biosynthesis